MTQISKKAYKGLPVSIKVRKPHYYYQDFLEVFNDNTEKYIELREFEGLDYSFNRSQVTFDEKVLWNGYTSPNMIKLLAPHSDGNKSIYNLTTVGYPSIKNGVAKGFGKSNYLQIGNIDLSTGKSFEMFTKVTTGSDVTSIQVIFVENNASYFSNVRVEAGHFCANTSLHNSSTSKALTTSETATSVQPNTTYWVKFVYDNETKTYSLFSSIDNEQWNLEASLTDNQLMTNWIWNIGSSAQSKYEYPFSGSIDLNESYIKIDDKVVWQLEENIVPNVPNYLTSVRKLVYGVKGSPTIVDNVASGFSSSNYVTIDTPKFGEADTWEIFIKITTGSDVTTGQYMYQFGKTSADSGRFGIALVSNDSNTLSFKPNLSFTGSAWASDSDFTSVVNNNYTLEANTTYYTKLSFDGNCYRVEVSKNNIDWEISYEGYTTKKVYSGLTYTRLGSYNNSSSVYFRGSIDLNESYIKLDDKVVWGKDAINVVDGVGCLDNITDVAEERTLTAFVKDDEILLSESGDDKVGYTWANKVTIPQHEVVPVYKKKFSETNTNYKYTYQDENILVSLNPSGELVLSEPLEFNFIPPTSFFDYDVRFTAKVTPVDATSNRVICVKDGVWFGTYSGKVTIDAIMSADVALTANNTYWVRMAETYSVSTGKFILRVCYILDNGYTKETLPDESEWVVKSVIRDVPYFTSESTIATFGWSSGSYSWFGTMDLNNIWVDYGNTTDIGDGGRLYQTKWEMLEKV